MRHRADTGSSFVCDIDRLEIFSSASNDSSSREYSFTITPESCASLSLSQEAFASGCRQLVMLGAGLDTLAWRHSLQTGAACFELDHPATQAIKRRAFQKEMRSPVLIAADLTRDLPSRVLRCDSKFDPSAPVAIIAEGLLMYFSPERVSQLLEDLAKVAAPGSKIAFTFMEARPGQPLAFHNGRQAVNSWLKARGEPFQWGIPRDARG